MSHVTAAPNVLAASAGELAAIGSTMRAANAAAAAPDGRSAGCRRR